MATQYQQGRSREGLRFKSMEAHIKIGRTTNVDRSQVAKIRVGNIFSSFVTHEMETDFIMEDRTILGSESEVLLRNCKSTGIGVTKGIEEEKCHLLVCYSLTSNRLSMSQLL
jgi:hypothetical protein